MRVHKNLDDIELHQDKIKHLKNVMYLLEENNLYDAYEEIRKVISLLEQDQINVESHHFGWVLPH